MAHLAVTPTNVRDAREALKGKVERKIGNNTYLVDRGDAVAMRLHDTDIVTYAADGITLDSGGWKTPTTKDRISSVIVKIGWHIYANDGEWFLCQDWNGAQFAFSDGCTIKTDSNLTGAASTEAQDANKATRKAIAKYAAYCADHLQDIGTPSNGDCLYCHMQTADGDSLGDKFGNADHLTSHLEEPYYVPSLVINALRDSKATDLILSTTWAIMGGAGDGRWPEDVAREQVKRSVKKYMTRRLGL